MINKKPNSSIDKLVKFFGEKLSASELAAADALSSIAVFITNARSDLKMTQTQFAKYMGVTQGMVSRWENGDYNFTIEKLFEIAEKLNADCFVKLSRFSTKSISVESYDAVQTESNNKMTVATTTLPVFFNTLTSSKY